MRQSGSWSLLKRQISVLIATFAVLIVVNECSGIFGVDIRFYILDCLIVMAFAVVGAFIGTAQLPRHRLRQSTDSRPFGSLGVGVCVTTFVVMWTLCLVAISLASRGDAPWLPAVTIFMYVTLVVGVLTSSYFGWEAAQQLRSLTRTRSQSRTR